jgi:hypothetical protein
MIMRLPKWFAFGAAFPVLAGLAFVQTTVFQPAKADTPAPRRVHGTIDKVDATSLELTTRTGAKVMFKLASTTGVVGLTKASTSDIKANTFIGTAAIPQPDGTLKALEIHIFPASMNGTGEGERPWGQKNTTMTNGMVGDVVGNDGRNFTVKFDGKERKVVVPANAPIVMIVPADRSLLTTGAKAIVFADSKDPKTAGRVIVGENGVTPPM